MKLLENFSDKEINYSLFGNLLGDAYLRSYKNTAWLENSHTNKQKDYVLFLNEVYKVWKLDTKLILDKTRTNNYGTYSYSSCNVRVKDKRHFDFNRAYNNNNVKLVSNYVLDRITPFGLFLWYLDDGSLTIHSKPNNSFSRQATISTNSFTYEEHLKIQKMFKQRFDIDVKIHKSRTYYLIYFNAMNFRKFIDLVRPYIGLLPQSMLYKFNMKYVVNRNKNSEELVKNYNF